MKNNKKLIILLTVVVVLLFVTACSFTTANLTDVGTASQVDSQTMAPMDSVNVFGVDSPVVYVTTTVNNAPEETVVTAEWIYVDGNQVIVEVPYETQEVTENIAFSLTKPTNGFPAGKYEVKLYIDNEYSESAIFTVE